MPSSKEILQLQINSTPNSELHDFSSVFQDTSIVFGGSSVTIPTFPVKESHIQQGTSFPCIIASDKAVVLEKKRYQQEGVDRKAYLMVTLTEGDYKGETVLVRIPSTMKSLTFQEGTGLDITFNRIDDDNGRKGVVFMTLVIDKLLATKSAPIDVAKQTLPSAYKIKAAVKAHSTEAFNDLKDNPEGLKEYFIEEALTAS